MTKSLKNTTLKNVSYNAIGRIASFVFQSVANIVITRELTAADYGVVGFAMICVSFLKSFSGLGINSAAIHAKEFDDKSEATAFTLRLLLGLVVFAITIGLSNVAELFFKHKEISSVIRVLAFAIIIDSFSSVSIILLTRKLKYSLIAIADAGLFMSSSIVAIVMAINGYKYWSIVCGYISANIIFTVICYYMMPYRLKFAIDPDIAKQYLSYGSKVFTSMLLWFAVMNMDNFIIGSVAGATQLGFYAIAFNWGSMVCSIMGAVVLGVLFPTFSRMQDDPARMKRAYLGIIEYTALLSLLCNIGLFCVAENFLISVLGKGTDKWLPALHTLQILCIYGILRSLVEPASSLLMAQGKVRVTLKANFLVAIVELIFVYPAIKYGSIEMVGLVVSLAFSFQLFVYLPALKQNSNIRTLEIVTKIWPALTAGLIMYLFYSGLEHYLINDLLKLGMSVLVLTMVYLLAYGIFTRWRVYRQLREMLPKAGRS